MLRGRACEEKRRIIMKRKASSQGGVFKKPRLARMGTQARMPMVRAVPAARNVGARAEVKTVDLAAATYTLNTTAVFTPINIIQEGPGFNQRVGRKVMLKSLHLTGYLSSSGNVTTNTSEYTRILLVYDRQPNGAVPTLADVLQDVTFNGTTSTGAISGLNMNNSERFLIIRDSRFFSPSNGNAAALSDQVASNIDYTVNKCNLNEFCRLNNLQTHYQASAGAVTDISSGSLLLITFGNVAPGSEGYAAHLKLRLRYHDV